MSALTSLLVRDQVVSVRKIEDAIQRQVISGGDLESALLEMEAVPENVMSAYRAALYGLLPATREEVMTVPRDTVKLVPREVAERYRLIPLWAENRTLMVAVTEPLRPEVDEQLAFLLGHELVYRIVTDVRLLAGLGHHYGIEVPARARRLAEKLRQREAGEVPYVAPPQDEKVSRPPSEIPKKSPPLIEWDDDEDEEEGPEASDASAPAAAPIDSATAPVPGEAEGEQPAFGAGTQKYAMPGRRRSPRANQVGVNRVVGVGPGTSSIPPAPREEPARATASPTPRSKAPTRKSARPASKRAPSSSAIARKLRGPLTPRAAVELLGEADNRDEILDVFFAFAKQFFDYTALFGVHDDVADGREAWGPGASAEEVSRITVSLDRPGSFKLVKEGLQPLVRDLSGVEVDGEVVRGLQRVDAQPAMLLPVTIRGRVVLMVYGDRDGETFDVSDVPELLAFAPRVSDAFEKLILKRKSRGYSKPPAGSDSKPKLESGGGVASTEAGGSDEPVRVSGRGAAPVKAGGAVASGAAGGTLTIETTPRPPRPGALGVLGVPRSAPPPPMASLFQANEGKLEKTTRPDGTAAQAAATARGQRIIEPLPPEADDGPEISIEEAAADDPDLEGAYDSEEEVAGRNGRAPFGGGGYSLREATTEVLGDGGSARRRSSRPPAEPAQRPAQRQTDRPTKLRNRADARREDDGAHLKHDVVRLPQGGGVGPASGESAAHDEAEPGGGRPGGRRSTPSPSDPAPDEPSVIVDMGDTVESLVEDLCQCGPDDEGPAVDSLLSVGEAALPALVQHFPGPLWFDRHQPHKRLPRGRDVSAVARAIVKYGDRSIPYVASLLGSRDPDVRFYATLLASEIVSPELLLPLADRIFDDDPGTRLLVLDVLRLYTKYTKTMEEVLKGVRLEARVDRKDVERRLSAIRALGELRDPRAVELLIELLGARPPELSRTAHRSLVTITRQDFGDAQRKWQTWLERNQDRHRIEWLIESLLHSDEGIRAAAGDELKSLTQEYYGYHPSSPKRDREIAQRKYRGWWEEQGRRRFA